MIHQSGPFGVTDVLVYLAWAECSCGRTLTASDDTEQSAKREVARKLRAHIEMEAMRERHEATTTH